MSNSKYDIILSQNEQHSIRKLLGEAKTITEYLSDAADLLKGDSDWLKALTAAAPWLKDIGEEVPILKIAIKLLDKWLSQTHPYELGAVACTLAYQQAVAKAIEKHWTSAISYQAAKKMDDQAAKRIRALPPAEEADLSTFTIRGASQHPFVRRADEILYTLMMQSGGFDEGLWRKVFDDTHDGFIKNLEWLLTNKKTAEKFAPFKDWMDLDGGRQASLAALQIHAKYQRDQYESEPLFKREPYALKHIYVDTECGKLRWREIRGQRDARRGEPFDGRTERCDPFSENYGGRHNLLETVMGFINDKTFNEPIVIQGVAGAGKSSFTLRLCAELWSKGFHPIRIRLKRLQLSDSLIDALNKAIELADEERLAELPIDRPDDLLLKGEIFKTPYGGERALCRYVVILDGWDELEMSDSKTFKEKVSEMLFQVRRELLDANRMPRVRVIVTGRPSSDVVESKFLHDDTPVLTMRSIRPEQLRKFVEDLNDAVGMAPPYIEVEKPEPWLVPHHSTLSQAFTKYEQAFKQSLPKYDEQGKVKERGRASDSSSLEVLGLPLLAYLTIRVMADVLKVGSPLEQQQAVINEMVNNPTLLYRRLTDLTCEKAGKAAIDARDDQDEVERQAREVGLKLRERLRQTAAAMSVLGVEHISQAEWEKRVPPEKDQRAEQQTKTAEDHPLSRLMISFYFKGGQPEQGCEFAHKSFREYLFAECIVETMKEHASRWKVEEFEHLPQRRHWRDFSESEGDLRRAFSRDLAELLAPQWLLPNVLDHLRQLVAIEISRAKTELNPPLSKGSIVGLQTPVLGFECWKWLRDVLADLWEWWADGAHLRPQIKNDRRKGSTVEASLVEELIRWAAPKSVPEDDTLELESAFSLDAHLGEGLCELCALVHFHIATADGWTGWELSKTELVEIEPRRKFQKDIKSGKNDFVLFAPGGLKLKEGYNEDFHQYIARVNAAYGRPRDTFPTSAFLAGTFLQGVTFAGESLGDVNFTNAFLSGASFFRAYSRQASFLGANLNNSNLDLGYCFGANFSNAKLIGASLDGAKLEGASFRGTSLDGTKLNGASLERARYLTLDQIKLAWIDKSTRLPKELEKMKTQILEWQQKRSKVAAVESTNDEVEIEDDEFELQEKDDAE